MTRTRPPLRVYKIGHFGWLADCRRCLFMGAYDSQPLAMKAALFHHDDCLYKTTERPCHADALPDLLAEIERLAEENAKAWEEGYKFAANLYYDDISEPDEFAEEARLNSPYKEEK